MRNSAVHQYFGVDEDLLWDAVTGDLPELVSLLWEPLDA